MAGSAGASLESEAKGSERIRSLSDSGEQRVKLMVEEFHRHVEKSLGVALNDLAVRCDRQCQATLTQLRQESSIEMAQLKHEIAGIHATLAGITGVLEMEEGLGASRAREAAAVVVQGEIANVVRATENALLQVETNRFAISALEGTIRETRDELVSLGELGNIRYAEVKGTFEELQVSPSAHLPLQPRSCFEGEETPAVTLLSTAQELKRDVVAMTNRLAEVETSQKEAAEAAAASVSEGVEARFSELQAHVQDLQQDMVKVAEMRNELGSADTVIVAPGMQSHQNQTAETAQLQGSVNRMLEELQRMVSQNKENNQLQASRLESLERQLSAAGLSNTLVNAKSWSEVSCGTSSSTGSERTAEKVRITQDACLRLHAGLQGGLQSGMEADAEQCGGLELGAAEPRLAQEELEAFARRLDALETSSETHFAAISDTFAKAMASHFERLEQRLLGQGVSRVQSMSSGMDVSKSRLDALDLDSSVEMDDNRCFSSSGVSLAREDSSGTAANMMTHEAVEKINMDMSRVLQHFQRESLAVSGAQEPKLVLLQDPVQCVVPRRQPSPQSGASPRVSAQLSQAVPLPPPLPACAHPAGAPQQLPIPVAQPHATVQVQPQAQHAPWQMQRPAAVTQTAPGYSAKVPPAASLSTSLSETFAAGGARVQPAAAAAGSQAAPWPTPLSNRRLSVVSPSTEPVQTQQLPRDRIRRSFSRSGSQSERRSMHTSSSPQTRSVSLARGDLPASVQDAALNGLQHVDSARNCEDRLQAALNELSMDLAQRAAEAAQQAHLRDGGLQATMVELASSLQDSIHGFGVAGSRFQDLQHADAADTQVGVVRAQSAVPILDGDVDVAQVATVSKVAYGRGVPPMPSNCISKSAEESTLNRSRSEVVTHLSSPKSKGKLPTRAISPLMSSRATMPLHVRGGIRGGSLGGTCNAEVIRQELQQLVGHESGSVTGAVGVDAAGVGLPQPGGIGTNSPVMPQHAAGVANLHSARQGSQSVSLLTRRSWSPVKMSPAT